ncbi:MAG: T9SS type A sorting domain-containing protein [bacterium]|nr:T9SS type A sorting domain-containing protein [bacterium]
MSKVLLFMLLVLSACVSSARAQSYTSYFTGLPFDSHAQPAGGVCMMGGATEHDEAMRWFLRRAQGGDILVLRASGADGYNDYLYSELGIDVNSVETIVCHNANAANEPYIHNRIANAEGIWFAGGDQWDYVSFWRDTPIDSLVNVALAVRNVVVGGTSAGMAILGGFYFTAQNGTVTSEEALANPYNTLVTVDSTHFLEVTYLEDVVTDTHYDNPVRKGRHVAFLARVLTDYGVDPKGIACNEYTAVCINDSGLARVYGDYPNYQEAAFFIQTNCELADFQPESCTPGQPLEWNHDEAALRVCKVWGTNDGANTFDLNDWEIDHGGVWENWSVSDEVLNETAGTQVNCDSVSGVTLGTTLPQSIQVVKAYPNPFNPSTTIRFEIARGTFGRLMVYDVQGRQVAVLFDGHLNSGQHEVVWDGSPYSSGIYLIELVAGGQRSATKALLLK